MAVPGKVGDLWPVKAPEWEVSGVTSSEFGQRNGASRRDSMKSDWWPAPGWARKACILYLSVSIQVVVTGKRTDGERGQLPPKERLTLSGLWRGFFFFEPKACFHKEQGKDFFFTSNLQIN